MSRIKMCAAPEITCDGVTSPPLLLSSEADYDTMLSRWAMALFACSLFDFFVAGEGTLRITEVLSSKVLEG